MLTFFFAFFISFSPSPTDSIVTPYTIAFADAPLTIEEPIASPVLPAVIREPAAKRPATPVAAAPVLTPAVPAVPSLFANGGLLDPSRLSDLSKGQIGRVSADMVVSKVQSFYKDTLHLTAKFRQTVKNKTFGRESVSDGWLFIKKPGKMRWDYYSKKNKKKVSKSFISDGTTIWAVFHEDLQFYKKSVKDDLLPVAITFLSGKGDLKTDFRAEIDKQARYGKKGDYVIKLTPKKPNAQYTNLWLVVDPATFRVKQSVVLNSNGDTNQFAFHEGNTKRELEDKTFIFNEKANKKFRLVNPDKAPAK